LRTRSCSSRFCETMALPFEQWNDFAGGEILKTLLKEHVVSDSMVEGHFLRNSREFESAIVARIVVHDDSKIKQIMDDLATEVDFAVCAQRYSNDPLSRYSGGYVGEVRRGVFPSEVEEKIFSANSGEIIGPIRDKAAAIFYKVHKRRQPELLETLKRSIREWVFCEWLRHQVSVAPA